MSKITLTPAEVILHRLTALDVDHIFINSGTDYPPMIEAMAKMSAQGEKLPNIVVCPHESAAMGMADGYHFATGKSQAVMVHTDVGLANTVSSLLNSACNNVPTLLFSGRTPITEKGHFGSRDTPIGYGQEMRDQAALVRESVKWDFELRQPDQIGDHIDRAYAIANSEPKGPVYLSLPREPLSVPFEADKDSVVKATPSQPNLSIPHPDCLAEAAKLLAHAQKPVIFAQRGARSQRGFDALSKLANRWGIPVVEFWATEIAISSDDPMSAGGDPQQWLPDADVVLVLDSLAPWMMSRITPPASAKIIQLSPDPLFTRYPVRSYAIDISLTGDVGYGLEALINAMEPFYAAHEKTVGARIKTISAINTQAREKRKEIALSGCKDKISKAYLSYVAGLIAEKYDGLLIAELAIAKEFTGLTRYNSYYQEALAGGLGNGFPIALGAQLADRDRLIIAALGDGCYMFSNPVACHQIAEACQLPVLLIIANNNEWKAVENGTRAFYPDGFAAKANHMPAVELSPSPDFTKIAEASRALGIKVTHGSDLIKALEQAVTFIRTEKRAALVEVSYE